MSLDKTIKNIAFEISEIDKLFESYSILIGYCQKSIPDLIEMSALAAFLHSFYSGIEKIFSVIAKDIDKSFPKNSQWHSDLLMQMSQNNERRKAVICDESLSILKKYLAFRHFFRHAYTFKLDWENLEDLSLNVVDVWERVKSDLELFVKSIK